MAGVAVSSRSIREPSSHTTGTQHGVQPLKGARGGSGGNQQRSFRRARIKSLRMPLQTQPGHDESGTKNHQKKGVEASLGAFASERRPGNKRCILDFAVRRHWQKARRAVNKPLQRRPPAGDGRACVGSAIFPIHPLFSFRCAQRCAASGLSTARRGGMPPTGEGDAATDATLNVKVPVFTSPPSVKVQTLTRYCQTEARLLHTRD